MTTETQGVAATAPLVTRPFAWRRAALGFALTLVAIVAFVTAFAAAYAAFHDGRVLPGVSAGNVSLAGLDRPHAEAALRRALPSVASGALTVKLGEQTTTIPFAEVARDYDIDQMLDEAFSVGRGGTPTDQIGQQLRTLMSGVSIPTAVKFDGQKLATRIGAIAAAAAVPAVDATIAREGGRYVVIPAVTGERVDGQAVLAQAAAALGPTSAGNATIAIEPTPVSPGVSTDQAQAAVDSANNVAARPLTIAVAGTTQTIDAPTINGWTHLDATAPGHWKLTIERAPIEQWVSVLKDSVDVAPTDAGYTFEGNKAVVTGDAPGRTLDATAASSAISDALNARASETASADQVALATTSVAPEFTADQAQSLVSRVKRLSTWTTRYDASNHNGFGQNIRRPTNLIDGTVVQPGETFDYLAVAGPITVKNGYTDGAAIIHGNSVLDGVLGGGLCSSSTTLFNAALRAGFDIGERRNHAYYIDRYPVGLDATIWVSGSYEQSMSFTNDSQYPVLIRGINRHNSVTFSIYGVPDGRHVDLSRPKVTEEKPAWTRYVYTDDVAQVAPGGRKRVEFPFRGFNSSVERVVTDASGNVIHDDTFNSSYRRVIGEVLIGWQPGDPPPGTVEEPAKPADAE